MGWGVDFDRFWFWKHRERTTTGPIAIFDSIFDPIVEDGRCSSFFGYEGGSLRMVLRSSSLRSKMGGSWFFGYARRMWRGSLLFERGGRR